MPAIPAMEPKFKSLLRGGRGALERLYLVSPEFEPQCWKLTPVTWGSFISAQPRPVNAFLSAEQRGQVEEGKKSLSSRGYLEVSNALGRGPRTLPHAPTVSMCILRLTPPARCRGLCSFRGSLLTCSSTLWIIETGAVSMARTGPLSSGRKVIVLALSPLLPWSGGRQTAL